MMEKINHPVLALKWTQLGGLNVGALKEGEWRNLKRADFEALFGRAEAKEDGYV